MTTTRGDSLHLAALRGKPYRIAACLGRRHHPDILDDRGRTPLFIACSFGHVSAARTLLQAGANVDLRTPEGMSPLDAVLRAGYAELLRELVWAGADLNDPGRCLWVGTGMSFLLHLVLSNNNTLTAVVSHSYHAIESCSRSSEVLFPVCALLAASVAFHLSRECSAERQRHARVPGKIFLEFV